MPVSVNEIAVLLRELGINAGLISFLVVVYSLLANTSGGVVVHKKHVFDTRSALVGLCFGLGAVLAMLSPLKLHDGLFIDAKTIIVGLAGAYLPFACATIATLVAVAFRAYLGGFGVWAGIAALVGAALLGIMFQRQREHIIPKVGTGGWLLGLGLSLATLGLALVAALPVSVRWELFLKLLIPVGLAFPSGVVAFGVLFEGVLRLRKREDELRIAATAFESQEGMYVLDTAWRILRVNQAFVSMTGFSAAQAAGSCPMDLLFSASHGADFRAEMTTATQTQGVWKGEVLNRHSNGTEYPVWLAATAVTQGDGSITHYVITMTDMTERKASEEKILSLAFYDPLTQLANRRLLTSRLEQAMVSGARHEGKGALLFIDLDNFKTLNDTMGHEKGDLLLQQVAERIKSCVRHSDTAARLGGDEFVVMLENLAVDPLDAATLAKKAGEKIHQKLSEVYQLDGHLYHSTPSIGVTLFCEQPEGTDGPMRRADIAMYQAKAAGRNMVRFFDPKMQQVVAARLELEAGLHEALAHQQFVLHYQAQVTGQREVTGVEVLVRWQHPKRGLLLPAEFIALAESTGQILALGDWVLESACTQLAQWAQVPEMAQLSVAVNVSARQVQRSDFVDHVLNVLARTGADPRYLKMELTESLLVTNVEDVIVKMIALKSAGVGFSMDDFGVGYSSLAYLKRLPLDQLKIDQSFVRDILLDPNDAAIAKMIVVLAHTMGLHVIAEGVETQEQEDLLAQLGCYAYQGFLYSEPITLSAFQDFMRLQPGVSK